MTEHLKNLRAVEVSYVPRGANRKKFLVLKETDQMAKPTAAEHITKLITKMVLKNDDKVTAILKDLAPEDADAVKAAIKVLQAMGDQVNPATLQELMGLAGMGSPEGDAPTAKAYGEMKERAEKAEKALAEKSAPPPTADDDIPVKKDGSLDLDKIPVALRPTLKALWSAKVDGEAKLAATLKTLNEERDSRITKEYTEIAEGFKHLPVKKEELGKVLKTVALADPDGYKLVEKALKAADEAVAKADPTAELGSTGKGGAPADSYEAIEAQAMAQPVAKEKGWNKDKAVTHFITKTAEGRKAYSAYSQEQATAARK